MPSNGNSGCCESSYSFLKEPNNSLPCESNKYKMNWWLYDLENTHGSLLPREIIFFQVSVY